MAEMTIRLECDPVTGKKNLVVTLRRDDDLLPHEHEQRHRQLIEQLIGEGLLTSTELGQVIVQREEGPASVATANDSTAVESPTGQSLSERAAQAEGGR